jgi:AcrR family transcriptional regulator
MVAPKTTAGERRDGRTARATRTRAAVVDAFLTLIDEGHLRPTAREVSERAGVSLRSVFQHFADLESLFAAAADLQIERLQPYFARIPLDGPFGERLEQFVESRGRVMERITPVRRAALLHERFSEEVAGRLRWVRDLFRAEVARVFSREVAGYPSGERQELVAALTVCTAWTAWETLRAHNNLSEAEAKEVMARTIRALLHKEV